MRGEVRCRHSHGRDGLVGAPGALGDGEREGDVLLELRLNELLGVGEVEHGLAVGGVPLVVRVGVGHGLTGRHLRGEHGNAVDVGRVAVGLAVGDVQLGGDLRAVAGDRRLLGRAGQRPVEDVVRSGRGHLPADAVQDQLGGGVVVDGVPETDALLEGVQRLGFRLGGGGRAAVGLARRVRGRTLVVVAPLVGEVAVEVDAVAGGDLAVAVVVAQVLAPQAVLRALEGVVVTVRVGGEQEPQLGGVEDLGQPRVLAIPGQVVLHQPAGHLGSDPLPGVLVGRVQHRGLGAVRGLLGVLGELQGQDVAPLDGFADADDLGEVPVVPRSVDHLLHQPVGTRVRTEDPITLGLELALRLRRNDSARQLHTLPAQPGGLLGGEVHLDLHLAAARHLRAQLMAVHPRLEQQRHLRLGDLGRPDPDSVPARHVVRPRLRLRGGHRHHPSQQQRRCRE